MNDAHQLCQARAVQTVLTHTPRYPVFRPKFYLIWLVVLLLVGALLYNQRDRWLAKPSQQPSAHTAERAKAAIPVTVAPVTQSAVPLFVEALGTVTSLHTVTIRAKIDGELVSVNFKEGQQVHAGDLLAAIDARAYETQLAQAQGQLQKDRALLENAQADWQRYQTLLTQDSISAQQTLTQAALVKQYQATIAADEAAVAQATLQLSHTRITAPISGRTGLRLLDPGNMVRAAENNGLVVITQQHPIAVVFTLPENQLSSVLSAMQHNNTLKVLAYDRSGQTHLGTGDLIAVDNQIDLNTGTIKLKAQFANMTGNLFVNQFVTVKLLLNTLPQALTIPTTALQQGSKDTFVYAIDAQQTVSIKPVQTGITENHRVVITQGLRVGELVVIEGIDKLRAGDKVKIVTEQ